MKIQMKINLLEFFRETVAENQNKVAVIDGDNEVTFGMLDNKSDRLCGELSRVVNARRRPIAVFLPKTISAVIADIAILKSGNAFMNLDVKTPTERITNILKLIKPAAIVTNSAYSETISSVCGEIPILDVDADYADISREDVDRCVEGLIDTDLCCIINTSGSTGTPKGVALNHLNFLDFLYRSQESFKFSKNEVIGSLSPIVFDIFVFELFEMMLNSATLVLLPAHLSAFPAAILKIMRERGVTFIFWVPTIMVNIANMGLLHPECLPDLRLVWFAGEVFPTKQFNIWRNALPKVTFANLYGPIETSLDSIYYIINRDIPDNEPIPIGYAYRNTDILLLDSDNRDVKDLIGAEGEICVRGSSLAMGYYNNPEKTSAAFVQNPLNPHYPETIYRTGDIGAVNDRGEIMFRGRKDTLIKHQGYRIELGEIEHIIVNTLHMVKNGCAVYNLARKEITFIYENEAELSPSEFRRGLSSVLPKYMIPTIYLYQPEGLLRNTNGKIDRLHYKGLVNGDK